MEKSRIVTLLEKTYQGPAWHGPSVLEALKNISPQIALRKTSDNHSIIELVAHMAAWRNFVTKRLNGDGTYEVSDAENFPSVMDLPTVQNNLKKSQADLLTALSAFPEERLFSIVPTRQYDFYTMLHGIIQHDIYHTGQIILLKK